MISGNNSCTRFTGRKWACSEKSCTRGDLSSSRSSHSVVTWNAARLLAHYVILRQPVLSELEVKVIEQDYIYISEPWHRPLYFNRPQLFTDFIASSQLQKSKLERSATYPIVLGSGSWGLCVAKLCGNQILPYALYRVPSVRRETVLNANYRPSHSSKGT